MHYSELALLAAYGQYAHASHLGIHSRATTTLNVDTTVHHQTMDGFGFSEYFGFGGAIYNLPSGPQTKALDLLFSTSTGAGFSILRNGIASSGSSDIEPNKPSSPSATPSYVSFGTDNYQIFWSKQAIARGVKTIYADAWSAPGFMKTTGSEVGGYLCGVTGKTCSSGDWRQAYANFLVKYVQDYAAQGITVSHLSFLNEPDFSPNYASMLSDGQQAADVIKVLHPALQKAGLSTIINCCESTGPAKMAGLLPGLESVDSMYGTVTFHGYTSQLTAPLNTTKPMWLTETADLDGAWDTSYYTSGKAGEGQTWANRIHTAIYNGHASAYFYWIGGQGGTTNSQLLRIDGQNVEPSARLWVYGHYSRFVRPGATRVNLTGFSGDILATAFLNTGGSTAVVVLNNGGSSSSIKLSGLNGSTAKAYVTNNSQSMASVAVTLSGGAITASIPAHSIMTFSISS